MGNNHVLIGITASGEMRVVGAWPTVPSQGDCDQIYDYDTQGEYVKYIHYCATSWQPAPPQRDRKRAGTLG